jgi:dihydrofolate reductase
MFANDASTEIRDEPFKTSGAIVMGRRMFDLGAERWGGAPPFHMPVFVITHRAGDRLVEGGGTTYFFVTDGVAAALAQARAAAGDKNAHNSDRLLWCHVPHIPDRERAETSKDLLRSSSK